MKLSTNLQRFQNTFARYLWIGAFFLIVVGIIGTVYFATLQINYVWRWYRVPQYFAYQEEIEIRAENEGEVAAISLAGDKATIQIKGSEGTQSYSVPTQNIRVNEGDLISPGDVLATYKKWRAGILAQGMGITLKVSVYAIFFGIFIGLIGGIARISSNPTLKWLSLVYVEIIRGSPLLVQVYIWYFVIGTMINQILARQGIQQIAPMGYGVAALAFSAGAYLTEIVRAGIQSIHRGQIEAARSLGMTYTQAMGHIVLPQALRRILPPLAGEFISLIKDSSLLGIIAVRELLKATREIVTTSLQPFEFFFTCAVLYLVLTFTLSMCVRYLERRMATP
jgi:polar amino acid transport system permease protein